tara:strand:- start:9997 stop:11619 length:1623 start_codon:yes stop_codon:yes gene_type:complete
MVVPFLVVLVDPSGVHGIPVLGDLLRTSGERQSIVLLGAAFCVATIVSALVRLLMLYATTKFTFVLGADISLDVYRKALLQPYAVHISRNSSEVINSVASKASAVSSNIIGQFLTISSAVILSTGVVGALIVVSPVITLVSAAGFVALYIFILLVTRKAVARQSQVISIEGPRAYRALQEGLGGIRDVIIDGTQDTFVEAYRISDRRMRVAQARIIMAGGSPRFLVESLGMVVIVVVAITATAGGASASIVAVLGALALGAQRLLPVIQQAYAAIITIRGSEALLWDVLEILDSSTDRRQIAGRDDVTFERQIQFSDVSFRYAPSDQAVLDSVSFIIPCGARVGIYGPTGGGKSTLLDLLMGLLHPTSGEMLVDDVKVDTANRASWQKHIAHVPQSIFLTDASIAENIAFGRPRDQIETERVRQAAQMARIGDFIESLPADYETSVGERGTRLSGGQRQRVGIARALYKKASLIIFDEATSALDSQTETEVMAAINGLSGDLTVVIVAHRMTTLRGCDILFEVRDGRVRKVSPSEAFGGG